MRVPIKAGDTLQTLRGGAGGRHSQRVTQHAAVPLVKPPCAGGNVRLFDRAKQIQRSGGHPVRQAAVHLAVFEAGDVLHQVAGDTKLRTLRVLVDDDGYGRDPEARLNGAVVVVVVVPVRVEVVGKLVPGDLRRQRIVRLGVGHEAAIGRAVVQVEVRSGDLRGGIDRADRVEDRDPVTLKSGEVRDARAVLAVHNTVGLIEWDIDELL